MNLRSLWRRHPVPLSLIGVAVVVLAALALLLVRAQAGVSRVALADELRAVTVVRTRAAEFRPQRRYVGNVDPWLSARVGPQLVSAYVRSVEVRAGERVKRGQLLAALDCRGTQAMARAATQQASALETQQRAVQNEASRITALAKDGYVAANEVELKQALSQAQAAQLAGAREQLQVRGVETGDCTLRAPFDGEVASRLVDPGAFVRPGTALLVVVDRSRVRVTFEVPEADFASAATDALVRIFLVANGSEIEGRISRRAPAADPNTRTVHVEIDLENGELGIPVGTTADISLDLGLPTPATELPLVAAKVKGTRATVFTVTQGLAESRTVEVMGEAGGSLFVAPTLLPPGTQVVTQGRSSLAGKERVVAKEEAFVSHDGTGSSQALAGKP